MVERDKILELAAGYLRTSIEEINQNMRDLPDDDAIYAWNPWRGGSAVIIGGDGSVLYANSSVGFETHLAEFQSGRRTDPNLFIDDRPE
jgi:hypothetical protein